MSMKTIEVTRRWNRTDERYEWVVYEITRKQVAVHDDAWAEANGGLLGLVVDDE